MELKNIKLRTNEILHIVEADKYDAEKLIEKAERVGKGWLDPVSRYSQPSCRLLRRTEAHDSLCGTGRIQASISDLLTGT